LKELGLTNADLLDTLRGPDGLVGALQLIHDHLQTVSSDAQVGLIDQIFGRTRGGASAIDLINHLGNIRDNLKYINADAANFATNWYTYTQTTVFQTQSVKASVNALAIIVGEALEPAFQRVLGVIGPIIAKFAIWAEAHPDLIAKVVTLVLAVSGLGAAFFGTISVVTRIAALLLSGPGIAFAIFAGIIYLLVTRMDEVRDAGGKLVAWFDKNLKPKFEALGASIEKNVVPPLATIGKAFVDMLPVIGAIGGYFAGAMLDGIKYISDHFGT